jgi:hypothetical protein
MKKAAPIVGFAAQTKPSQGIKAAAVMIGDHWARKNAHNTGIEKRPRSPHHPRRVKVHERLPKLRPDHRATARGWGSNANGSARTTAVPG